MGLAQTDQNLDLRQLKQEIIDYSRSIGIDKIGFAAADPFAELKQRLIRHRELGYESGFEEPDIEKRTTPTKILPEAQSIIAIALAYPSRLKHPPRSKQGAYRGILCRASWGLDYHHILRDKLQKLESFIKSRVPDAHCESMVDTGALSDRAVAERAGIGWSGKNTAIITKEFGSWVYLGEMLTSIPFEPDQPVTESCGTCNKCIEACPTGALVQGGQLDSNKCIAYLTQVKNFVPLPYREKIGNRLYGCDTCQTVCPHNRKKNFTHHPEMEPDPQVVKPLLKPMLYMSKREFRKTFGPTASAWRGKKPLQRNAIIALGNFKDETAVPELIDLLHNDPRPAIRGTAAWALGKIGTEEGRQALKEAQRLEADQDVLAEVEHALNMFNH
ncbi:epoxyqueuosine reductase [Caldalkalibacillus uzonensis]|uniref:Epoxyqueuosine reductase n=1 Tax=Caldalkalibacillus uzonensis TaxID=353224 RepID=A0ABU0CXB7_9BACI|nr:tRNA epoxyqueuosine(34) reductase QueG [Caldalkalibacillus uzonensis]MDQ0340711.1 epoxyqueuosine reductase [Caldalkalibacillus uzonensis]